jgi:hypothetical protein
VHQITFSLLLQDFTGSCAVNCKDTPAPLKMALSIWWENSFNGAWLAPVQAQRICSAYDDRVCMHVQACVLSGMCGMRSMHEHSFLLNNRPLYNACPTHTVVPKVDSQRAAGGHSVQT